MFWLTELIDRGTNEHDAPFVIAQVFFGGTYEYKPRDWLLALGVHVFARTKSVSSEEWRSSNEEAQTNLVPPLAHRATRRLAR